MRRLRRYRDLHELDLPIILLVGGATGTGKSTVATEVAYRLGITRVTSTDFVRQTMRAFFSQEFMPSIHHSSFEAGRAMADEDRENGGDAVLDGFLAADARTSSSACERRSTARSRRAGRWCSRAFTSSRAWSRQIEGALVVECVLSIEDDEAHASHFWIRDADSEGVRPYEKYLDPFDDIRLIQTYIVGRARKHRRAA